jgi:hypothetical protein
MYKKIQPDWLYLLIPNFGTISAVFNKMEVLLNQNSKIIEV